MPPPASLTRLRSRSVVCARMLPAICAGPWWWTKLSPPSSSSAAATMYSCSAASGAVGVCVAASWPGRVSRQGTWGSSCAGQASRGPMVTAATVDASAVRSAGLYCVIPAVSRASCLQAAVQVTSPQFLQSGSAPSALLLPLCCTVVAVWSRGALLQCLRALPRRGGGGGRLQEALRAQALWVRVVRVLLPVLRRRPGEEEELVQVPVALRGGRIVECQPLFHHASRVCGLDAALQPQAAQAV